MTVSLFDNYYFLHSQELLHKAFGFFISILEKDKMIVVEAKRHILKLLPYLGCTLITTHFGEAWRMSALYEKDLRIMGFIEIPKVV